MDHPAALDDLVSPGVLAPPHEVLTPDEWRARGRERRIRAPGRAGRHGPAVAQAATDPFLGWTTGAGTNGTALKHYYVRQLRDMKGSMSVPLMDPLQLDYYGRLCGWALARAHARTGRATMISGYLGIGEVFDHAIADFAVAYADQNEQDYQRLLQAVSAGRVLATIEQ
jgi:Uncharacterized protein conserved in bacteria (DUF2252)